jgi:hypothetical protein
MIKVATKAIAFRSAFAFISTKKSRIHFKYLNSHTGVRACQLRSSFRHVAEIPGTRWRLIIITHEIS